jgi:hypothetical protein
LYPECDAGAVGVCVVVVVVGAADADATVDVDADGDDTQRTKPKVNAKKRTMEDRAILALTAQRADVHAKNTVTVVAVVDLADCTDGAAVAAADMQPPTLGHHTAQIVSSSPSFLLGRPTATIARSIASTCINISISELFTAVNNNFV